MAVVGFKDGTVDVDLANNPGGEYTSGSNVGEFKTKWLKAT